MIRAQICFIAMSTFSAIAMSASSQTNSTGDMIQQSIGSCLQSSQNMTSSTSETAKSNCLKVIDILNTIGKSSATQDPIILLSEGVAYSTVVSAELIQSGDPIDSVQCNSLQKSNYAFYQLSLEADPTSLSAALSDSATIKKAKEMYDFSAPQRSQLITQQPACRTLTGNPTWPSN
jgi:hypothetical protein